jgi:hypothetical protein
MGEITPYRYPLSMDGASWALIHIKDIIDIKGVLFWVLHFS